MNIQLLSTQYEVRRILDEDISAVLDLCKSNPQYYHYFPPAVSAKVIKSDLIALPPCKDYDDKYYIGFYNNNQLMAVMDLILRYPDKETAFISFFMVNSKLQGQGVGTNLITECLQTLKRLGYIKVRLGILYSVQCKVSSHVFTIGITYYFAVIKIHDRCQICPAFFQHMDVGDICNPLLVDCFRFEIAV